MTDRESFAGLVRIARRIVSNTCFVLLSVSLWLGTTLLGALGAVFAVAVIAASGDPLIFFSHLGNLSDHYLFADQPSRALFDRQLAWFFGSLFILAALARVPLLLGRLRTGFAQDRRS